jgi:hypothetical protein
MPAGGASSTTSGGRTPIDVLARSPSVVRAPIGELRTARHGLVERRIGRCRWMRRNTAVRREHAVDLEAEAVDRGAGQTVAETSTICPDAFCRRAGWKIMGSARSSTESLFGPVTIGR